MEKHPLHYLVTVKRYGHLLHSQMANTEEEATELVASLDHTHDAEIEITPIHEPSETDLTAHTRELVEDLQEG